MNLSSTDNLVVNLTPEQEKEVQKLFYVGNNSPQLTKKGLPTDVMVEKFNIEIKRDDLCRLKPCVWLNDEVSNFFFSLLSERSKNDFSLPKSHFFNTFFYALLSARGNGYAYARVMKWTKDVWCSGWHLLINSDRYLHVRKGLRTSSCPWKSLVLGRAQYPR